MSSGEIRERIKQCWWHWFNSTFKDPLTYDQMEAPTDAMLIAIGAPANVLAWIIANSDAAKGLAEGTIVAVRIPNTNMSAQELDRLEGMLNQGGWRETDLGKEVFRIVRHVLAASPPARVQEIERGGGETQGGE